MLSGGKVVEQFLWRTLVGYGDGWKSCPLPPSPVRDLQRDPSSESLLYLLQMGQWWPEASGLAALMAEPGEVAALGLPVSQSLQGPRMGLPPEPAE